MTDQVAATARCAPTVHLDDTATITGRARAFDHTRLEHNAHLTGKARTFGAVTVRNATLGGHVTASGYATIENVELHGNEHITANAAIHGPDDIFTTQPPGDPHTWTTHRTTTGWTCNAGCYWNHNPYSRTPPDFANDPVIDAHHLATTRLEHLRSVARECRNRDKAQR